MHATGEEAQVQQPVAAVAHGDPQLVTQAAVLELRFMDDHRLAGVASEHPRQWQGQQRGRGHAQHRHGPAGRADDQLQQRGEHELAQRAASIDEAGGERTPLWWQAPGGGADQDRETACAGTGGGEYAQGEHQARTTGQEWRQGQAGGKQQAAGDQDRFGAVAVGDRAEHRLHRTPHELADGQGQADGGDADAGVQMDRGHEQPGGLAHAEGQQQHGCCGQDQSGAAGGACGIHLQNQARRPKATARPGSGA